MSAGKLLLFLAGAAGVAGFGYKNAKAGSTAPDLDIKTDPFTRWDAEIKKACAKYRVPWRWAKAIMIVESNLGRAPSVARGLASPGDIDGSKSTDGKSWGLMQVTATLARALAPGTTPVELNNPLISIDLGCRYLGILYAKYKGDKRKTVISYNQGETATDAGKDYTGNYFAKVENALKQVLERQPGNERDFT